MRMDRLKLRIVLPCLSEAHADLVSVIVTMESIPKGTSSLNDKPVPSVVGRPLPNSAVLICSEENDVPLQQGQTGEICILGPQVARG